MKIKEGQSLFDLAIQICGSADAAVEFAILNDINLTDSVNVDLKLITAPVINKSISDYYAIKNLLPATALKDFSVLNEGIGYWAIEIDFIIN